MRKRSPIARDMASTPMARLVRGGVWVRVGVGVGVRVWAWVWVWVWVWVSSEGEES